MRLAVTRGWAKASRAAPTRSLPAPAVRANSTAEAGAGGAGRQRVALVAGSSRGIGLEFVAQLLQRHDTTHVYATCRQPSEELAQLSHRHSGRLTVVPQLDTTDEASIARAAEQVAAAHQHLDLLINATGILHDAASGVAPETALSRVTMDGLLQVRLPS